MLETILFYAILIPITTGIGSCLLATSLWLLTDKNTSPFERDGRKTTWLKCTGLVFVVQLLGLVTFGGLLGIVVWYVGIMSLFEQTFGQAILLSVANWGLNMLLGLGIGWLIGLIP